MRYDKAKVLIKGFIMRTLLFLLCALVSIGSTLAAPPKLTLQGKRFVDPQGKPVTLRGVNLGNWFVIEHWMWDQVQPAGGSVDGVSLEAILTERFGETEKNALMELYRNSWITERDFSIIKSFRFNLLRIPLNYRLFESDAAPMQLKPDAWVWLDRIFNWADQYGFYLILDMHAVQGSQNPFDHSGEVNRNQLWSVPSNQTRLAWLWRQIATRYKNRSALLAYDPMNEPYGGTDQQVLMVTDQLVRAIRQVDANTLIYAHDTYNGIGFYGDPKNRGWRNVGFQRHFYPGIFDGRPPTPETHFQHLSSLQLLANDIDRMNVPLLIGEMNVLFKSAGGAEMMRRTFDLHESYGWQTTMWSYKALSKPGGVGGDAIWGMVTNKNRLPNINFRTSRLEVIREFFRMHADMPYTIYEDLRKMLAPERVKLPEPPAPRNGRRKPLGGDRLIGWSQSDIGGSLKGGLRKNDDGTFDLYGGGEDIWGSNDQFNFLHRKAEGDFSIEVQIAAMENIETYSKAGLMIRTSLDPHSPHVLLSVFPSGEVQFAQREPQTFTTRSIGDNKGELKDLLLRLTRKGERIKAEFRRGTEGEWQTLGETDWRGLPASTLVGPVALSHDNRQLIEVRYRDLKFQQ